jgi:hypothetical protein
MGPRASVQTNVWIANDPSIYAPMLFFLGHFKPYNVIVFSFRNKITLEIKPCGFESNIRDVCS